MAMAIRDGGTIFSCDTNGNYTPLYNFTAPHGSPLTNVDGDNRRAL